MTHCKLHSAQCEGLDGIAHHRHLILYYLIVIRGKTAQDKVHLSATRIVIAYTELQAVICLGAKHLSNMFETIVAGSRTVLLHAYGPHREREVIDYDQKVLERHILLLHPIAHSVTGKVHVRGWLQQYQLGILDTSLTHKAIALVLPRGVLSFGQGIYHAEAYVVARATVFVAYVAQAYNQVFHIGVCLAFATRGRAAVAAWKDGSKDEFYVVYDVHSSVA